MPPFLYLLWPSFHLFSFFFFQQRSVGDYSQSSPVPLTEFYFSLLLKEFGITAQSLINPDDLVRSIPCLQASIIAKGSLWSIWINSSVDNIRVCSLRLCLEPAFISIVLQVIWCIQICVFENYFFLYLEKLFNGWT